MAMKVELRSDCVHISGYVNAVDRFSRPIKDRNGKFFKEKILPGAFQRAIDSADDVTVMLNHERSLTRVKQSGFTLKEDSIGLFFEGDIRDGEVIEKAKKGKLKGWSFGFSLVDFSDTASEDARIEYERAVKDMKLHEVSIIDDRFNPYYEATSIQARATEGENEIYLRADEEEPEILSKEDFTLKNELRKRKLSIKKRK